ncbi:hypothetical protein RJT34_22621 [Clitoria ternatea]|uniref:Uncharacterized protein n=1 Tax=Clitoria ternatea TaxID=43366 RepID=A0AAN9FMM8_CLITE
MPCGLVAGLVTTIATSVDLSLILSNLPRSVPRNDCPKFTCFPFPFPLFLSCFSRNPVLCGHCSPPFTTVCHYSKLLSMSPNLHCHSEVALPLCLLVSLPLSLSPSLPQPAL